MANNPSEGDLGDSAVTSPVGLTDNLNVGQGSKPTMIPNRRGPGMAACQSRARMHHKSDRDAASHPPPSPPPAQPQSTAHVTPEPAVTPPTPANTPGPGGGPLEDDLLVPGPVFLTETHHSPREEKIPEVDEEQDGSVTEERCSPVTDDVEILRVVSTGQQPQAPAQLGATFRDSEGLKEKDDGSDGPIIVKENTHHYVENTVEESDAGHRESISRRTFDRDSTTNNTYNTSGPSVSTAASEAEPQQPVLDHNHNDVGTGGSEQSADHIRGDLQGRTAHGPLGADGGGHTDPGRRETDPVSVDQDEPRKISLKESHGDQKREEIGETESDRDSADVPQGGNTRTDIPPTKGDKSATRTDTRTHDPKLECAAERRTSTDNEDANRHDHKELWKTLTEEGKSRSCEEHDETIPFKLVILLQDQGWDDARNLSELEIDTVGRSSTMELETPVGQPGNLTKSHITPQNGIDRQPTSEGVTPEIRPADDGDRPAPRPGTSDETRPNMQESMQDFDAKATRAAPQESDHLLDGSSPATRESGKPLGSTKEGSETAADDIDQRNVGDKDGGDGGGQPRGDVPEADYGSPTRPRPPVVPFSKPSSQRMGQLDRHVMAAPAPLHDRPVYHLVQFLLQPTTTEVETAYVLFRWVTGHKVQLGPASSLEGEKKEEDEKAEESTDATVATLSTYVQQLKDGTIDHADMFSVLCKCANLETHKVGGKVRYYCSQPCPQLVRARPATWSALLLPGGWGLVDCGQGARHWAPSGPGQRAGSGHASGGGGGEGRGGGPQRRVAGDDAEREYTAEVPQEASGSKDSGIREDLSPHTFYFLPAPDVLVASHLPDNPRWQLLPHPVAETDFLTSLLKKPHMHYLNVDLVSPTSLRVVDICEETDVIWKLKGKGLRRFAFRLFCLSEGGPRDRDLTRHGFLENRHSKGEAVLRLLPPCSGRYVCELYGTYLPGRGNEMHHLCSLDLDFVKTVSTPLKFPHNDRVEWGPGAECVALGLTPVSHSTGCFSVDKGEAEVVFSSSRPLLVTQKLMAVEEEGPGEEVPRSTVNFRDSKNKVKILLRIPEAGDYVLSVYAKHESSPGKCQLVCNYLVLCDSGTPKVVHPFPSLPFNKLGPTKAFSQFRMKPVCPKKSCIVVAPYSGKVSFVFTSLEGVELSCDLLHLTEGGGEARDVGDYVQHTSQAGESMFRARLPLSGDYLFHLYGKPEDGEGHKFLLYSALIECGVPNKDCLPLPRVVPAWRSRLQILAPLRRSLVLGVVTHFAVRAHKVKGVAVRGQSGVQEFVVEDEEDDEAKEKDPDDGTKAREGMSTEQPVKVEPEDERHLQDVHPEKSEGEVHTDADKTEKGATIDAENSVESTHADPEKADEDIRNDTKEVKGSVHTEIQNTEEGVQAETQKVGDDVLREIQKAEGDYTDTQKVKDGEYTVTDKAEDSTHTHTHKAEEDVHLGSNKSVCTDTEKVGEGAEKGEEDIDLETENVTEDTRAVQAEVLDSDSSGKKVISENQETETIRSLQGADTLNEESGQQNDQHSTAESRPTDNVHQVAKKDERDEEEDDEEGDDGWRVWRCKVKVDRKDEGSGVKLLARTSLSPHSSWICVAEFEVITESNMAAKLQHQHAQWAAAEDGFKVRPDSGHRSHLDDEERQSAYFFDDDLYISNPLGDDEDEDDFSGSDDDLSGEEDERGTHNDADDEVDSDDHVGEATTQKNPKSTADRGTKSVVLKAGAYDARQKSVGAVGKKPGGVSTRKDQTREPSRHQQHGKKVYHAAHVYSVSQAASTKQWRQRTQQEKGRLHAKDGSTRAEQSRGGNKEGEGSKTRFIELGLDKLKRKSEAAVAKAQDSPRRQAVSKERRLMRKLWSACQRREREAIQKAVTRYRRGGYPPCADLTAAERLLHLFELKDALVTAIEAKDMEATRHALTEVERHGYAGEMSVVCRKAHALLSPHRVQSRLPVLVEADMRTLLEIRNYRCPPAVVHHVTVATLLLTGVHEGLTKTWKRCQRRLQVLGPQGIHQKMLKVKVENIHPEICARVRMLLDKHTVAEAHNAGSGVLAIYKWATSLADRSKNLVELDQAYDEFDNVNDPPQPASKRRQREIFKLQASTTTPSTATTTKVHDDNATGDTRKGPAVKQKSDRTPATGTAGGKSSGKASAPDKGVSDPNRNSTKDVDRKDHGRKGEMSSGTTTDKIVPGKGGGGHGLKGEGSPVAGPDRRGAGARATGQAGKNDGKRGTVTSRASNKTAPSDKREGTADQTARTTAGAHRKPQPSQDSSTQGLKPIESSMEDQSRSWNRPSTYPPIWKQSPPGQQDGYGGGAERSGHGNQHIASTPAKTTTSAITTTYKATQPQPHRVEGRRYDEPQEKLRCLSPHKSPLFRPSTRPKKTDGAKGKTAPVNRRPKSTPSTVLQSTFYFASLRTKDTVDSKANGYSFPLTFQNQSNGASHQNSASTSPGRAGGLTETRLGENGGGGERGVQEIATPDI